MYTLFMSVSYDMACCTSRSNIGITRAGVPGPPGNALAMQCTDSSKPIGAPRGLVKDRRDLFVLRGGAGPKSPARSAVESTAGVWPLENPCVSVCAAVYRKSTGESLPESEWEAQSVLPPEALDHIPGPSPFVDSQSAERLPYLDVESTRCHFNVIRSDSLLRLWDTSGRRTGSEH